MPSTSPPEPLSPPDRAVRRRLPAEQRRALIVDAAVKIFAERGYLATSMEEVGAAAGVTKAVVYDHFASKRELYTRLLDEIRDEIDAAVDLAMAPAPSTDGRVRAAVEAFFAFVEQNPLASRLLFIEVQGTTEVADLVGELEERFATGLTATLHHDRAIFRGHPARDRQLRILAELFKAAIHGLASWWYRNPEVPRDELVDRSIGVIIPAIDAARSEHGY